jgi:hypothetical protein
VVAAWAALGITRPNPASAAKMATATDHTTTVADLFRDIFGNPFRPAAVEAAWLTRRDGAVVNLARAAYQERDLPSGHLDNARLAALAQALEQAGCADPNILDPNILGHLRSPRILEALRCVVGSQVSLVRINAGPGCLPGTARRPRETAA